MGLSEIPEHHQQLHHQPPPQQQQQHASTSYYPTLTREEKARMHPCKKAKCVMMSTDTSPTLTASLQSAGYVELPEEPRPGKITPTTPTTNTTNSSPSPRAATSRSNNGSTSHDEDEVIEEAVPIVRTTLPSPEPQPLIERNGYKEHDRLDGVAVASNNNGLKKPAIEERRNIDEDSCLIKCVYFTQQCCECVIV